MKESDLAKVVVDWLKVQHWDVYQEVQMHSFGSIIDILAVRQNITWAIECKTSLSLTVLAQAYRHSNICYRSIAVPNTKKRNDIGRDFAEKIARNYGIGIICVDVNSFSNRIIERVPAKLKRSGYRFKRYLIDKLVPEQKDFAEAGNANNERYTPYGNTIRQVKFFIRNHPGCTIKDICNTLKTHYGEHAKISNLRQALKNWESDWCNIRKEGNTNKYYLK